MCGRLYGSASYSSHLKTCQDLFVKKEAFKPSKEDRKPLPEDPFVSIDRELSLSEMNDIATEVYNSRMMATCQFCLRTFTHEQLPKHNKSCTAEKPAKRSSIEVSILIVIASN